MRRGWHSDSARHSLAAKGVKTGRYYQVRVRTKDGKKEAILKNFATKAEAVAYADRVAPQITPPYPSSVVVVGQNQFRFLHDIKKKKKSISTPEPESNLFEELA